MSDRKYKQRGYQDDGGERPARSRPSGPGPRRDPTLAPGGRGLGKPTATVFRCKVCGTENSSGDSSESLPLDATCTRCGADLHTCTHCVYFDTSATNQCREPEAERVAAKAKRNECDFFKPRRAREFKQESDSPRDAKSAFDALFNF